MKPKLLVTLLALALAGCAGSPEKKLSWEVKPVMNVHHGMANAAAYYQLGRHSQAQGRLAAAEEAYEKALIADSNNVDAWNALGALYAERGELDRAASAYRKVGELAPQRAYLFNNIGYALYLQGRYAEAVTALRQAVTLDPRYERAWVNLQNVAQKAGMPEIAALAARRSPDTLAIARATANDAKTADIPVPRQPILQPTQNAHDEAAPLTPPAGQPQQAMAPDIKKASETLVAGGKNRHSPIRMSDAVSSHNGLERLITMMERFGIVVGSSQKQEMPSVQLLKVQSQPSPPVISETPGMPPARVEVSNANGVNGYASHVRRELRGEGFSVTRLTNFPSFNIPYTIIEYRSGFADAARLLKDKLGRNALLRELQTERPRTDVRLILGRDWIAPQRTLSEADTATGPRA